VFSWQDVLIPGGSVSVLSPSDSPSIDRPEIGNLNLGGDALVPAGCSLTVEMVLSGAQDSAMSVFAVVDDDASPITHVTRCRAPGTASIWPDWRPFAASVREHYWAFCVLNEFGFVSPLWPRPRPDIDNLPWANDAYIFDVVWQPAADTVSARRQAGGPCRPG
jgi:hypothetical protein